MENKRKFLRIIRILFFDRLLCAVSLCGPSLIHTIDLKPFCILPLLTRSVFKSLEQQSV